MEELTRGRRLLVLAICCSSLFIVGLDSTIVNLALPAIRSEFGASVAKLQWTIDAYTLVLASLLMVSGSTADRVGRRRTFQVGLVLFGIGSLLCGVASTVDLLIAFRVLQAVGGSMLNPVAMSIITNTFTDPRERAQAIGVWGGVVGLSMAVGPVVGGSLVDAAGWRFIFWINVPVAVAAVLMTAFFVPESRAAVPRRMDPVGQVLVVLLLGGLTYGIIEGRSAGWGSPLIIGCFVVCVVALVTLVYYERRREQPLLEPRFFRSAPFSGATLIAVCGFSALSAFLFLNSLYLQSVRGFTALHAGLLTLPMAAMTVVFAPLSGWLVGHRGPRVPLVVAGTMLTAVRAAAVVPDHYYCHCAFAGRLPGLRTRLRHAERTYYQRSRLRHATSPGRCSRSHRLHQPPGRRLTGRRCRRHRPHRPPGRLVRDRLRRRGPALLVHHRGLRSVGVGAGVDHYVPMGPSYGGGPRQGWMISARTSAFRRPRRIFWRRSSSGNRSR